MGVFVKGEVVIVPFPFSDLTNFTRRPAVVIAQLEGNDVNTPHALKGGGF
jgi:mRNA interferase MazF